MQLNDATILEFCQTSDLVLPRPNVVQPASCDLHLGPRFREFRPRSEFPEDFFVDPEFPRSDLTQEIVVAPGGYYFLEPMSFALAHTIQTVGMPLDLACRIEGKSSLGRQGLLTHVTAGFVDPGFRGELTLELFNLSPFRMRLRPEMRICQVSFNFLNRPAERGYGHHALGSKYNEQEGPTAARPMRITVAPGLH